MPSSRDKPIFGNLPIPVSTFIGREQEIKEIRQILLSNRLITLTGPGGCGKTRLALKVAQELTGEFEQHVWFVELSSVADPALVSQTVASTLNIQERSGQSLIDALVSYLSRRDILLITDNCEHLISTCAQLIEALLQKCPGLKVLATSREVLGITGEASWTVPPLSLPSPHPWKNPTSAQDALSLYEESESVQCVTRGRW